MYVTYIIQDSVLCEVSPPSSLWRDQSTRSPPPKRCALASPFTEKRCRIDDFDNLVSTLKCRLEQPPSPFRENSDTIYSDCTGDMKQICINHSDGGELSGSDEDSSFWTQAANELDQEPRTPGRTCDVETIDLLDEDEPSSRLAPVAKQHYPLSCCNDSINSAFMYSSLPKPLDLISIPAPNSYSWQDIEKKRLGALSKRRKKILSLANQ